MKNRPIKLLFDVNPLVNSQKSGVGYYTEHLLSALAARYPKELQITAVYSNFLNKKQLTLPEIPNITYKCNAIIPSKVINILRRFGFELPIELFSSRKADFIIYPNFVGFRSVRKTPSAVVLHDLGYLDCPQYLQPGNQSFLERFVPKTLKRSRFIITISEATKTAIQKHYSSTRTDDFVITPIPPVRSTDKPVELKGSPKKFILFVSTLEPRKNFISLVRGYMRLPKSLRREYGLVLAGGIGWNVEQDITEIKKLQATGENIITTGYISQSEKNWLLENAAIFVLPSHYEGFGMPILEAMAVGTPTAVSDIPVFREVSGEASVFFDQSDPDSIASALNNVIKDPKLQKKLVKEGHARVSKLDWNKIAESVYERILPETENRV